MERDNALRVGGHRSSLVSNKLAGMAIARPRTLRVYDIVSGKNASRSEVCGHIRVRIEHQTASKADSSVSSCCTDRVSPSRMGISGTPRPPHDNCERLGDDHTFSTDCRENCTAVA
jgi:hypothetical protein